MYFEAQWAVETDNCDLSGAHHAVKRLKMAITVTDKLSESEKSRCLGLIRDKVETPIFIDTMALCVAIDPCQRFGEGEPEVLHKVLIDMLFHNGNA